MSGPRYPALVLNASYEPLSLYPLTIWDYEKVFRSVAAGKSVVVEEHDAVLRSARSAWRPPAVIAMKKYVPMPERVPFSRMNILIRDRHSCQYCGKKLTLDELTFDHVQPRSLGGKTNFTNIVSACVPCNAKKANRTHMKPMVEPRSPTAREMSKLRPIRRSDVPEQWVNYLDWAGILTAPELDKRTETQRATDEGYWEMPLEGSN